MRDIDPQLMRLHEIEAKIVLLSVRLEEAENIVQALDREAVLRPVQEHYRRLILEALEILRRHRQELLERMQQSESPSP